MPGMEPGYPPQYAPPPPTKRTNGFAITALVLGLIGLLILGPLMGILAIIFGAVGMGFANKNGGVGKGLAVAGLVLGICDILVFIVLIAVLTS